MKNLIKRNLHLKPEKSTSEIRRCSTRKYNLRNRDLNGNYETEKINQNKNEKPDGTKLPIKPFSCRFCFRKFNLRIARNQHLKRRHNDETDLKKYSCPQCKKSFNLKFARNQHVFNVHGFTMKECKRTCKLYELYEEKILRRTFSCMQCSFVAHEDWIMAKHHLIVHADLK